MWKRYGSGKPQQRAAAMCGPSLAARPERQVAIDRSICSRLLSSGSQVRVLPGASSGGHFGSGMSATAAATGMSRMVLWKRCGSAEHHKARQRALPTPRWRPLASRVPEPQRVLPRRRRRRAPRLRDLELDDVAAAAVSFEFQVDRYGRRQPLKTDESRRTIEFPRPLAAHPCAAQAGLAAFHTRRLRVRQPLGTAARATQRTPRAAARAGARCGRPRPADVPGAPRARRARAARPAGAGRAAHLSLLPAHRG